VIHGKLVRDKIPAIIRAAGKKPVVLDLNNEDYKRALALKLCEEAAEFERSGSFEELADVMEVLKAILVMAGLSFSDLETARMDKRLRRGGFEAMQWLVKVDD